MERKVENLEERSERRSNRSRSRSRAGSDRGLDKSQNLDNVDTSLLDRTCTDGEGTTRSVVSKTEHEIKVQAVNEFKKSELQRIEDDKNQKLKELETTLREDYNTEREKWDVETRAIQSAFDIELEQAEQRFADEKAQLVHEKDIANKEA